MVANVASGGLVRLEVTDTPALFAQMGVVSLRGRSFSAMAEFAVGSLGTLAQQLGSPP